jgi:hypothetical protein
MYNAVPGLIAAMLPKQWTLALNASPTGEVALARNDGLPLRSRTRTLSERNYADPLIPLGFPDHRRWEILHAAPSQIATTNKRPAGIDT